MVISSFWGLLALLTYLRLHGWRRIVVWLLCATIGTLAKENAIVFFVIPQIVAFGFGRITWKQAWRDTLWAAVVVVAYFSARWLLTTDVVFINDEYFENTWARKLKNIGVFLGLTWLPLDYVSLVHPPCRLPHTPQAPPAARPAPLY